MTILMHDHPSWARDHSTAHRVMRCAGSIWALTWSRETGRVAAEPAARTSPLSAGPRADQMTAPPVNEPLTDLGHALAELGPVVRVRNSDLWDALGIAIIRQVIRAQQARDMYARFCAAHGQPVDVGGRTHHLFPSAEVVAALTAAAFAGLGMTFKRSALIAAADAYLRDGRRWQHLAPAELAAELQRVRRVGPWTAGAATADHTNDFALYPYSDLAVRTWARRAAPTIAWPDQEPDFAGLWRRAAGPHLSDLTLLTLAWGDHHARAT